MHDPSSTKCTEEESKSLLPTDWLHACMHAISKGKEEGKGLKTSAFKKRLACSVTPLERTALFRQLNVMHVLSAPIVWTNWFACWWINAYFRSCASSSVRAGRRLFPCPCFIAKSRSCRGTTPSKERFENCNHVHPTKYSSPHEGSVSYAAEGGQCKSLSLAALVCLVLFWFGFIHLVCFRSGLLFFSCYSVYFFLK